jgi:AcrR family transcriptional regulator
LSKPKVTLARFRDLIGFERGASVAAAAVPPGPLADKPCTPFDKPKPITVACRLDVAGHPPQPERENGTEWPDGRRRRLVAAVSRIAAEHGYAGLTIERIVASAGLDREAFESCFDSRDQSLLAAQESFIESLLLDAAQACERPAAWPLRLAGGLRAVLSSLRENASLARVFVVEADAPIGLVLAERRLAALDDFAALLRLGRGDWPGADRLPKLTERALVGAVASLVDQSLLREEVAAMRTLDTELTELLLIPYVGTAEARRIALGPPAP